MGAIDAYGQTCLDIGVMHFDAATAARLLKLFGAGRDKTDPAGLGGKRGRALMERGVDFYREICCAMGQAADLDHYVASAQGSGSKWSGGMLAELFKTLSTVPFNVQLLKHCDFLDFGASRAIISSGTRLLQEDRGVTFLQTYLDVNNEMTPGGAVHGSASWVESCRIQSSLQLGGSNVVVGVDIDEPLALPTGACLDVIQGRDERDKAVWFVRCYGIDDTFKEPVGAGAVFCGKDVLTWLDDVGADEADVWDAGVARPDRTIWNAALFPAAKQPNAYRHWLWMLDPGGASEAQHAAWRRADRYSLEQILALADHQGFYQRRRAIRAAVIHASLQKMFRPESGLSARELAYLLGNADDLGAWVAEILRQAHRYARDGSVQETATLAFPRIIHTLGAALTELAQHDGKRVKNALSSVAGGMEPAVRRWLGSLDLEPGKARSSAPWCGRAQEVAFEGLERAIIGSAAETNGVPQSVLRSDEIVWARAPARLDVGGGWTDTPPYSLEWGGCVTNAAVDLNGQPPIQAYVRVIGEPVIRIGSIDLGVRIEIRDFEHLLDYRRATGSFALAKAAMVLSGLSPTAGGRTRRTSLKKILDAFGGGIELTTLAAIPKGSGLGTSSIMGAVIVAALARAMGKGLSQRELFHSVLRLEQALTTGGGWQDQIGGVVDGVKMIVTEPGMVPDAHVHYVPADILDPKANGGRTLLYLSLIHI